jgi:hypothetical protein
MYEREGPELSHLDAVGDMDMSMGLHLDHTRIDMHTLFSKTIDKLEEILVAAHHHLAGKIIVAIREWTAMEIEPA